MANQNYYTTEQRKGKLNLVKDVLFTQKGQNSMQDFFLYLTLLQSNLSVIGYVLK